MNTYCVYVHTNKSDGKKYVGITRQRPEDRWRGGGAYKYNPYFYSAIKKYGWNGFTHEVLMSGLSQEEACLWEVALIAQYDSTNKEKGYNVSYGGEGHVSYSPMMRKKMSDSAKRRNLDPIKYGNICAGNKKRWERKGEREKITNGLNNYYLKNPERRKETSEDRKRFFAKHPEKKTTKKVVQLTKDGAVIAVWESMTEAAQHIGIDVRQVSAVCTGVHKTAGGYKWRYENEN